MKQLLIILITTLLATELACRLDWKNRLSTVILFSKKTFNVFRSDAISDHYKERVIPAYSLRVACSSSMILLYLMCCVAPFALAALLSGDFIQFFIGLTALPVVAGMVVISIFYVVFRKTVTK